jgi:hypothetical protein
VGRASQALLACSCVAPGAKKSAAQDLIVRLRKQNHSVYEINEAAFRRGASERLSPTVERVADVRQLSLTPGTFPTGYSKNLSLFLRGTG